MAKQHSGARAIDTASIVFGLVSIPVRVFSTSEPSHEIHFHMIHAGCGERLKQQYVCPKHGKVERAEMAKGYQVNKSTILELSKDELDALQAAKLVGIAAYAARGNAYVVMVRPFENGLAMHQLRYPDEIKPWDAIGVEDLPKPTAAELELAKKLVAQLEHDTFDAGAYKDEVKLRVRKLLDEKAKSGEAIIAPEAEAPRHIPDLMAALRASLEGDGKAKPTKAKRAVAEPKAAKAPRGHRTRRAARPRTAATHRPARARHNARHAV